MKKTKVVISGEDRSIEMGRKKKSVKIEDSGFNVQEMLDNPKEKDLVDIALIMMDFKKTAAFKYLEARSTQELKRLIKHGPLPGESADRHLGRLQGLLDGFEGAVKGVIISGNIAKANIQKKALDRVDEAEEINFVK